jgi:hypothetical protein
MSFSLPPCPYLPTRAAEGRDKEEALAGIASALLQHRHGVVGGASEHNDFVIVDVVADHIFTLNLRTLANSNKKINKW